ncbi:hypothetical protein MUP05_03690 [Candidatus Bathyarchaeota archaeon]|nr:hypothetical protein [Candidatus Bathyarchaeota archaeon]
MRRRREDLIALVPRLIENVLNNDSRLPVTIDEAWTFGSVPRGQEEVHDLDIVLLYRMDETQQKRWSHFEFIFGNYPDTAKEMEKVARKWRKQIHDSLLRHSRVNSSLKDALREPDIIQVAEKTGLNLEWVSCFSWAEYTRYPFIPAIEKILSILIAHRLPQRGLSVKFQSILGFRKGGHLGYVKSYRKVWDRATPLERISANFDTRTEKEDREFLEPEFVNLNDQLQQAKAELEQMKEKIPQTTRKKFKLKLGNLISFNRRTLSPDDRIQVLREKCYSMRELLRLAKKVDLFLNTLCLVITHTENRSVPLLIETLLSHIPRGKLTETETRHFMKRIGLPENDYVIYQRGGSRLVIGASSKKKRRLLQAQETLRKEAKRIESKIRRLLPLRRRWDIRFKLHRDGGKIPVKSRRASCIDTVATKGSLLMMYYFPRMEIRRLNRSHLIGQGWEIDTEWDRDEVMVSKDIDLDVRDDWKNIKERVLAAISPLRTDTQ